MKQDEIIEMAKQAGFDFTNGWRDDGESCQYGEAWPEQIEAFAKLVAAKEREACASLAEKLIAEEHFDVATEIRARGKA